MTTHVIVHQFDPHRHIAGGVHGFIHDLIRFAPADHEFSVIGVDSTRRYAKLRKWHAIKIGERAVRFMPVARVNVGDQRRRVPHTARLIAGLMRARPKLDRVVVHSHRGEVGALLTHFYPRLPHVQFLHGNAVDALAHRAETFWRFVPWAYKRLERRAVRRSAATVVMSTAGFLRLRSESGSVMLGANWFDSSVFRPNGDAPPTPTIGWAGRLEPPKDPVRAIEVFARLRDDGTQFKAWIAGSGSLDPAVRQAVARHQLDGVVEIVGLLDREQLAERLRSTSVFLMTSLFEGFPRAAVEALASGVPVVAPNVGEIRSVVRHGTTGFVSTSAAPRELGELVVQAVALAPRQEIASTVAHLEARRVVAELLNGLPGT